MPMRVTNGPISACAIDGTAAAEQAAIGEGAISTSRPGRAINSEKCGHPTAMRVHVRE